MLSTLARPFGLDPNELIKQIDISRGEDHEAQTAAALGYQFLGEQGASIEDDPYTAKGPKNSFGVPLSRVTNIEGDINREDLDAALAELAGKDLPNRLEGITAQVNTKQRNKLRSNTARAKSQANGFSGRHHNSVSAQVAKVWEWSALAEMAVDKNGDPNLSIGHYVGSINVDEKDAFVWITTKKSGGSEKIYSVELMDEKKLREKGNSSSGIKTRPSATPRSFEEIIERLNTPVKHGTEMARSFFQPVYHGSPYTFDQFTLEAEPGQSAEQAVATGSAAMDRVIKERTDLLNAMYRPGLGGISFYWGTEGKGPKFKGGSGVAHIIAHRNAQGLDGEAIARKMPEVLAYGEITNRQTAPGGDRVFISLGEYTAALSLYRFGQRETWLLTGWTNEKSPDAQAKVYDSAGATSSGPTRFQPGDGAGELETNIAPLGADGKPLFQAQAQKAGPRGWLSLLNDGSFRVAFTRAQNASTAVHEFAHLYRELARRLMDAPPAK